MLILFCLTILLESARAIPDWNQNQGWKFTTEEPTTISSETNFWETTPTPIPSEGLNQLGAANCEFPQTCTSYEPVCGSDCEIYPDPCYMQYQGCLQNKALSPHPLAHCTDHALLAMESWQRARRVLYGQSVLLECPVRADSGAGLTVVWFEITDKDVLEVGGESEMTVTNVTRDRTFFCQISNCQKQIVQSTPVTVTVPENLCLVYGAGHVHTFTQGSYSLQTDCTHVAAMDSQRGTWFIYTRYDTTWQIASPTLSSITVYYDQIPLEMQRGWVVNYFGRKVVLEEGQTKEMFGMQLTFDGLYLVLTTPHFTVHWDGLSSLIIGIKPDSETLGLCGNNRRGEELTGRFYRPRYQKNGEHETFSELDFVKSWAINPARCRFGEEISNSIREKRRSARSTADICDSIVTRDLPASYRDLYLKSCESDQLTPRELIAGNTPTYCLAHLAALHLQDKLSGAVEESRSRDHANLCVLSVMSRQYLAFFAGCPADKPPFEVT